MKLSKKHKAAIKSYLRAVAASGITVALASGANIGKGIVEIDDELIHIDSVDRSDRPDTMRGVGLAYVVIDEYADMKPQVFEQILRPALSDVKGGALFIGTPKGRNHFYELYQMAQRGEDEDWSSFHFTSFDNPLLDPKEIEAAKKSMSSFSFLFVF